MAVSVAYALVAGFSFAVWSQSGVKKSPVVVNVRKGVFPSARRTSMEESICMRPVPQPAPLRKLITELDSESSGQVDMSEYQAAAGKYGPLPAKPPLEGVGVGEGPGVGVGTGVGVGVGVGLGVGVGVGEAEGDGDGDGEGEGLGVGEAVGEGCGVGVGVAEGEGLGVGDVEGVGVGLGLGRRL
jgi:hypothetical protein